VSLKALHQVIIFAAMTISLVFAAWCFFSSDAVGIGYLITGIACVFIAIGLVGYEIHFLKRTRRLIIQ
jgi:uncharacterized membrane protein